MKNRKAKNQASSNPESECNDLFNASGVDAFHLPEIAPSIPEPALTPAETIFPITGNSPPPSANSNAAIAINSESAEGGAQSEKLSKTEELEKIKGIVNRRFKRDKEHQAFIIERAAEDGRYLLRIKALVEHGAFMKWVEDNLEAGHSWCCVRMILAQAKPYFEKARDWAEKKPIPYKETVEGSIALVEAFLCAHGEETPWKKQRNPQRKKELKVSDADERLRNAAEENQLLKQQLVEAEKRHSEDGEFIALYEAQTGEMKALFDETKRAVVTAIEEARTGKLDFETLLDAVEQIFSKSNQGGGQ